jgi:hypothetical protein
MSAFGGKARQVIRLSSTHRGVTRIGGAARSQQLYSFVSLQSLFTTRNDIRARGVLSAQLLSREQSWMKAE